MKKLHLLLFIIPNLLFSQLYDYKIKVDNSAKYRYETEYYKASADRYNKEIADGLKNKADEYFVNLQRFADFINDKNLNSKEVESEFNRLKYYGEEILNLLPLLNSNELTANKMEYTMKKAVDEFNYSAGNDNGNLRKLVKKNTLIRELNNLSDEELRGFVINKSSETKETLSAHCNKTTVSYKNCLINLLIEMK